MSLTWAEILQHIQNGNIDVLINYIKGECKGNLESTMALNISIGLASYLAKLKPPTDVSPTKIYTLVNYCLQNMNSTCTGSEKLLRSLYYVSEYFLMQEDLKFILSIADHIISYCPNGIHRNQTYKLILNLYHRQFIQLVNGSSVHIFEKLVNRLLILYKYGSGGKFSPFFSTLSMFSSFFKNVNVCGITNEQRQIFCTDVLQILLDVEVIDKESQATAFRAFLDLLHVVVFTLRSYTNTADLQFISTYSEEILIAMKKFCISEEHVSCITILSNLFRSIFKKLEKRTANDLILVESANKLVEDVVVSHGVCSSIILTCVYISRYFKLFLPYFELNVGVWNTAFDVNMLVALFEFFLSVGFVVAEKDATQAITITSASGAMIKLAMKNDFTFPDKVHHLNLQCFEKTCQYILKMQEKSTGFVEYWKYIGVRIYNTGVSLNSTNQHELAKCYSMLCCKYIILIEGTKSEGILFENDLGACLHLLATTCQNLMEYKEAMVFLSLSVLLCPKSTEKALQYFANIKCSKASDTLKGITLNKLLEKELDIIKKVHPNFTYKKQYAEYLLLAELHYYYEHWQSKIPVHRTSQELIASSKKPIVLTKAFIYSWNVVAFVSDDNYVTTLLRTINVLEKEENKNNSINLLCLSCLYFVLYQCKSYEVVRKNLDDMNDAYIPSGSDPAANQNDSCDIVPTYYHLKVDTRIEHLALLNKCLDLWNELLDWKAFDEKSITEFHFTNIIQKTAFEFRLQHFYFEMMRTWYIYYKLNKLMEDDVGMLEAIGYIIECSNYNTKEINEMQLLAEDLIKKLDETSSSSSKLFEVCVMYRINKSLGLLRSNLIKEGFDEFTRAYQYESRLSKTSVLKARLFHLKHIFLLTPCDDNFLGHRENFLLVAQQALSIMVEIYKNGGNTDTLLLSILFDISMWIAFTYKCLRFAREVRCYLRDILQLAQKLVIPIRTAQFLSLMAFADLLDWRLADCEVKLDGLTKLLNYRASVNENLQMKRDIKLENTSIISSHLIVMPDVQVLDNPYDACNLRSQASPELYRKSFVLPKVLLHDQFCTCLYCTNFEYQKLIFEVVHLEALLNHYTNGSVSRTKEYFDGGFLLYTKFITKYHTFIKNSESNGVCKLIYANLSKPVHFSYCALLLDYSYYLMNKRNFQESHKIITDIISLLKSQKQANIFFVNEVLYQEVNLRYISQQKKVETHKSPIRLSPAYETFVSKTPDNKVTKVILSVSPVTPNVPPQSNIKGLKLHFSDSDDDNVEAKKKTPKPKRYNLKPAMTPALKVPAIKISPIQIEENHPPFSEPSSYSGETSKLLEVKSKTQVYFQQRTRLLTEKLKAENKDIANKKAIGATGVRTRTQKENQVPKDAVNEITESMNKVAINTRKKTNACNCQAQKRVYKTRRAASVKEP